MTWPVLALVVLGCKASHPVAVSGSVAPASSSGSGSATAPAATCLDVRGFEDFVTASAELGVAGSVLHVCYAYANPDDSVHRRCIGIDVNSGAPSIVAHVEPPRSSGPDLPRGTLAMRDGKPVACGVDGACKPLGKQAAQAVQAKRDAIAVTSDGRVVIVDDTVWNVGRDRKLAPAIPDEAKGENPPGGFYPVGPAIVGTWTPCAGPCTVTRVFSADGALVADSFETEESPVRIDDTRWALAGTSDLAIYHLPTGEQLRTFSWVPTGDPATYQIDGKTYVWDVAGSPDEIPLIPLGNNRAAITSRSEPVIVFVDYAQGVVDKMIRIPICDDPDAVEDREELSP